MAGVHLLRPPAITCNECGGHPGSRQNPPEILHLKACGSGPELFLVASEMLEKWGNQPVLRIFSGHQAVVMFWLCRRVGGGGFAGRRRRSDALSPRVHTQRAHHGEHGKNKEPILHFLNLEDSLDWDGFY